MLIANRTFAHCACLIRFFVLFLTAEIASLLYRQLPSLKGRSEASELKRTWSPPQGSSVLCEAIFFFSAWSLVVHVLGKSEGSLSVAFSASTFISYSCLEFDSYDSSVKYSQYSDSSAECFESLLIFSLEEYEWSFSRSSSISF